MPNSPSTAPATGQRTSSRSKKPSNYARMIEEYQQQIVPKPTRKSKAELEPLSQNIEEESSPLPKYALNRKLDCRMSDGRVLKLEVKFSKKSKVAKTKPISKSNLKPITNSGSTTNQSASKPVGQNQDDNLLFKLLYACQEIEKDEEHRGKQNEAQLVPPSAEQPKKEKQEGRRRQRDEEEKYLRYFDRKKKLDEKLFEVSQSLVFL